MCLLLVLFCCCRSAHSLILSLPALPLGFLLVHTGGAQVVHRLQFDLVKSSSSVGRGSSVGRFVVDRPPTFSVCLADVAAIVSPYFDENANEDGALAKRITVVVKDRVSGSWSKLGDIPLSETGVYVDDSGMAMFQVTHCENRTPKSSPDRPVAPEKNIFGSVDWEKDISKAVIDIETEVSCEQFGASFPFLGRKDEMKIIADCIQEYIDGYTGSSKEKERTVSTPAFGGVSGCGKTRLAFEAVSFFNGSTNCDYHAVAVRVNCDEFLAQNSPSLSECILASALERYSDATEGQALDISKKKLSRETSIASCFADSAKSTSIVVVVNIDEAQKVGETILAGFLSDISAMNKQSPTTCLFVPVLSGLDLSKFEKLKTSSGRGIVIRSLPPVFDLWKVFAGALKMEDTDTSPFTPAVTALLVALDGVPRLLWVLAVALMSLDSQPKNPVTPRKTKTETISLFQQVVTPSKLVNVLKTISGEAVSSLYRNITEIMGKSSGAFTSLSDLSYWVGRTQLLSYVISDIAVNYSTQVGNNNDSNIKTVSDVVAAGYAMPYRHSNDTNQFALFIPLIYLQSNCFDDALYPALRPATHTIVSPGKPLTSEDAEALDISILAARFVAFSFLEYADVSLTSFLGGCVVPSQFENVFIDFSSSQASECKLDRGVHIPNILNALEEAPSQVSFSVSKDKAPYADSAVIFPVVAGTSFGKNITIDPVSSPSTRSGKAKGNSYTPKFGNSLALLIQSKRFLSTKDITSDLITTEWAKVEPTFSCMPFLFLIVTDADVADNIVPDRLKPWVVIIGSASMPLFLGNILSRRRLAAARVAQQSMVNPSRLSSSSSSSSSTATVSSTSTGSMGKGTGKGKDKNKNNIKGKGKGN
jgi:hypothetical protein